MQVIHSAHGILRSIRTKYYEHKVENVYGVEHKKTQIFNTSYDAFLWPAKLGKYNNTTVQILFNASHLTLITKAINDSYPIACLGY